MCCLQSEINIKRMIAEFELKAFYLYTHRSTTLTFALYKLKEKFIVFFLFLRNHQGKMSYTMINSEALFEKISLLFNTCFDENDCIYFRRPLWKIASLSILNITLYFLNYRKSCPWGNGEKWCLLSIHVSAPQWCSL